MATKKVIPLKKSAAARSPGSKTAAVVEHAIEVIHEVAVGNLAVKVDLSLAPGDPLLEALAGMVDGLGASIGELLLGTTLVDKASSSMTGTAKSLRDNAAGICRNLGGVLNSTEEMRQNMNSVSASTEELSANMQSIATAAQQSNDNVESIQTSIKELTTASREIAENTARATSISKEAMANVTAAFTLVSELTSAAKDIDVVTSTISEISDQTKLLALNATIEAARAGEMGKGFAVVAKEVKELASQTNAATKDIQKKIGIIHEVTKRTADAVIAINGVMKGVNDTITSIAAAAEEQSVTTNDIAQNVLDATERIKEMSKNVKEGAVAVQDVSKSIVGATDLANSVAGAIREVSATGTKVQAEAVTSYAEALEVASHGGDVLRHLQTVKVAEDKRLAGRDVAQAFCRMTRDYDVGVHRMNGDHQRIFDYINVLHQRIKDGTEATELLPTLKELSQFTRTHFSREEEAMQRAGYAGLPAQQAAHTKLLGQLAEIVKSVEEQADIDFIATLGFFREWLISHILGMDKKYGPSLQAAGID
jgi:methyl-accepting chemotaxis protein